MKNFLRAKQFLASVFLFFMFLSASVNVQATEYYVSTTGDDVTGDGSSGNPWQTIQFAVNNIVVVNGDVINVAAGTYTEGVTVSKTLTLKGAQADNDARTRGVVSETILNNSNGSFAISANGVTINGFTVKDQTGAGGPGFGYAIYMVPGFSGTQLLNNIIKNNVVGSSLANSGVSAAVIRFNWFDQNNQPGAAGGNGIYTDEFTSGGVVSNAIINSNKFTGHTSFGVDFSISQSALAATGITISNNEFSGGNDRAVFLYNIVSSSFSSNVVTGSVSATGSGDVRIFGGVNNFSINNNIFGTSAPHAIRISEDGAGATNSNITVHENNFIGYSSANFAIEIASGYIGTMNAECNYFGTVSGAAIAAQVSGPVDYVPFITDGTDNSTDPGFQPKPNTCNGCPNGNVKNLNTSITYCTIQAAIDDPLTLDGHILQASAGTFTENVNVYKQVTIKGNNAGFDGFHARSAESVVDGNFVSAAFTLNNDNITIDGFSIVHGVNGLNAGVWMNATKGGNKIINNIIRNNAIGVYANCASASLIQNNLFNVNNNLPASSGGSGIYSENTINLTVDNNRFTNHTENNPVIFGATGPGVHQNLVFNKNDLYDNTYGIYLVSVNNGKFTNNSINVPGSSCLAFTGACNNNSVKNNFFKGTYLGVRVEDDGYNYGPTSNININENSFTKTFGTYIRLADASYTPVPLNATCNWYETTTESSIAPKIIGNVKFKPYLTNGADNSTSAGFQPVPNSCNGPAVTCNLSGGNICMSPSTPVPGQKSATIYRGYGPQCLTLSPSTISGGTSPYTYKWNTGSTNKSISVCPTSTTTYTLTIKDAKGCCLVRTFKVYVIDVRCGSYKEKIQVCQYNKSCCLSKADAEKALLKGAKLGSCTTYASRSTEEDESTPDIIATVEQTISVYPNPSSGSFTVKLENFNNTKAQIEIVDFTGRIIEQRKVNEGLKIQTINFELSNKAAGMYIIKVVTEDGVKTQRITLQK